MNSRLGELRGGAVDTRDVELGTTSEAMAEFFTASKVIKDELENFEAQIVNVEKKHGQALSAVKSADSEDLSDELDSLMDSTNRTMSSLKAKIEKMEADNRAFSVGNGQPADILMRKNVYQNHLNSFLALIRRFNEIQSKFKSKYQERQLRQLKIVKPDATEAERQAVLKGEVRNVFADDVLVQPGHTAARNALADIEDKHEEVLKLERSIQELHQLFVDMSVLVEAQGELLDQIEYNAAQAVNYTGKGVEELRKANKSARKARKRMCCLIAIFLIIAVVGVVFLIGI